jgi:hypothetical protein
MLFHYKIRIYTIQCLIKMTIMSNCQSNMRDYEIEKKKCDDKEYFILYRF